MNETKKGIWIDIGVLSSYPKEGINCYHAFSCNICGCIHRVKQCDDGRILNANYCPNCGARMENEK